MSVKGLKLIREIPPDLAPVSTDRRKLLQILLNLASNAVKFTDHGEIVIRCERVKNALRLSVSATGIGIKAEDLALLFQPFSQLDDSLRKRHEGTGLGLNLSKRLAALLGGDLTVVSEYGEGSAFTVHMPYSSPTAIAGDCSGLTINSAIASGLVLRRGSTPMREAKRFASSKTPALIVSFTIPASC